MHIEGVHRSLSILIENLPQPSQFFGVNTFFFKNIQHQQLSRILKKTVQQMPNLGALGFVLFKDSAIDMVKVRRLRAGCVQCERATARFTRLIGACSVKQVRSK